MERSQELFALQCEKLHHIGEAADGSASQEAKEMLRIRIDG
jgi:hypothetical protein